MVAAIKHKTNITNNPSVELSSEARYVTSNSDKSVPKIKRIRSLFCLMLGWRTVLGRF
jgi:hypothetical protein